MLLLPLFYQILVLFFIVVTGFSVYRLKILDEQGIAAITKLLIDVTMPAMILISMNYDFSREILWESGMMFLVSFLIYLGSWFFALGVMRVIRPGERKASVYEFMLTFPNVGFMGFPVIEAIFGKLGVFYTAIFNLSFGLLVWTVGVWMFRRHAGEKLNYHWRILLTPGIMATLLGFFFFLFSIKLPFTVFRTLELIGGMTTPLSMLIVGTLMGRSRIRQIWGDLSIYLLAVPRLLIIPGVVFVVMRFAGFTSTMLGVAVVLAGMPAAANTALFATHYGGDAELASKCVFISTLLSTITIPLLVSFLNGV